MHRFDVKRSKMLSYSQNIVNNAELQKWYNYDELHAFDIRTNKNVALGRKPFKTTQNYKLIKIQWLASIWRQNKQKLWVTSQNIQNYANLRKWSNYNELHRFDVKTIYNALWVTSQNIQNYAKLRKSSNYNQLHRFDVKTIYNDELRRKTFKITQNYKSDQNTMTCIDLTSKRAKMMSYVAKHSKLRKTTKVIKL